MHFLYVSTETATLEELREWFSLQVYNDYVVSPYYDTGIINVSIPHDKMAAMFRVRFDATIGQYEDPQVELENSFAEMFSQQIQEEIDRDILNSILGQMKR